MNVKYLKNPDTKEKFYPITQSDCIIDSFSINDLEIDRLFLNSLSVSKHLRGMSYLNLQGLMYYHSKIKDYFNNIPEVLIYTAGENITIENNVISAVVPEVDLSSYATEEYVDSEIANIDIPSLNGYATELWVDDIYLKKLYVDLGLPSGLLWATMNVGASSPEDYGDYFAWGETEPKEVYDWSSYKYCNGSERTLTKYNYSSYYGTVDHKTTLEWDDDAAQANWGGNWRMPTDAEWTELREQCTWTWTTQNGVNGYKVTSKSNGNSIFLPAAGRHSGSSFGNAGSYGFYWSSSLSTVNPYNACGVYFYHSPVDRSQYYRNYGQSVRPVCEPIPNLDNTKTKKEIVNSTDGVYYFTTDTKEIYRNGIKYGYQVIYITEEELLSKVQTSTLIPGYEYCIRGFVSNIDTSLGLSNIGHKIDLHIRATSLNTIDSSVWASYNTDGSDSFFYDHDVDVCKWDIKISINNNHLGIVNSTSINNINPTNLYNARIVGVAHNGIDTLVVAYECNFVNVSTDGGNTFSIVLLPNLLITVQDVLYGLGYFVVFDELGHMSKSQDGFIWEQVSSFSQVGCTTACFSEDTFYITRSSYLYTTKDFINWTSMNHGIYNFGWGHMGLAAGDGKIIVTTGGDNSKFGVYDGSSWHITAPFGSFWNGVGFGNHTFAIVCGNARSAVLYNTDLTLDLTWPDGTNKYYSDGLNKDPGKVCYHDGVFYSFAVPYRSDFYSYSTDGLNWTPIYLPKRAYIGTYGQTAPTFGPNGEMYIAECESNRVWVNFTPLDGNTWQVLHSPGIDIYKTIVENTEASILCPYDPLSYYLTNDHRNYTYYRFPNDYESPGVVVSGNKFCTLLYDRPNSLTHYATSIDGINWALESIGNTSYCTNLTVNNRLDIIFGIFEDGKTCSIINGNVTFSDPGPTYINTKVIYDLNTESFLYSGAASESYGTLTPTTTIQKVKPLKDGTFDANYINLTTERVVSCLDTRADLLYVFSGKNFEVINLLTGNTITGTLSYDVNNSCNFYSKLITFGSNKSSLIYGTEAIDLQPEVDCVLPITDDLFLLSNTSEAVLYLGYVNFLTGIQVIELTDEFNNTCYFDFKNIIRDGSEQSKYFFDRFGEDLSLTGKIINFKLLDNNQLLLKLMQLKSVNYLQDCSVLQGTVGDVTTSNIMKCVSIKDVPQCNLSSLDLSNSKDKELWESNGTIYLLEACGDTLYYTQNNGTTWNVKNSNVSLEGYATEQWVEEQGYIKSIPPHTVTINFYNDIDYAVWHNMVGDIEITSMQSTNILNLYVSDGNNLNEQDIESALDNGPISITDGSTLTFDVIKTTDANGFAAVTLTYNIK